MKKLCIVFLISFFCSCISFGQGFNHQWLLGSGNWANQGRMFFDTTSYVYQIENRKMQFNGTEGNICDSNGNFLMSSNGVWIANANNDTMMNGTGLNPGYLVNSWSDGLPVTNGNIVLPYPGDSTKFVLFHQTESDPDYPSNQLYYSIIDITLDSGLGGVISKNDTIIQDTLSWGIGACKHANGRDWWIVMMKDSTNIIYKILLSDSGFAAITTQSLNYSPKAYGNVAQLTFSPDGTKFITTTYNNPNQKKSRLIICDFDRCTGIFSNTVNKKLIEGDYLWGLAFSPSGKKIYACSNNYIFQVDADSFTVDTVATYDGFISGWPPNCCATTFWNMYLAANGKIYVTSGSSTQHIHVINFPDSAGLACNVQQHAISLGIWNFRSVPNHPNYYLGRLQGSPCDTLQWSGLEEPEHDFHFRLYPNPISNNTLNIGYLLPQNKSGTFQIYDITGKIVFKYNLPLWSNEQSLKLPQLANGIYSASIISDNKRVSKILAIMNE